MPFQKTGSGSADKIYQWQTLRGPGLHKDT